MAPIADHIVIASQREAIDRIGQIASAAATISSDRDQTIQPTPGDTQLAHVTPSLSSEHVRRRDSLDAVSVQDSPSDGRSVRSRHDPC
ncbi:hypothetical protein SUGI_0246430 [Cryptomeria japonica]|nr:hypothetical protein SUGI_0246430 [Cryptomeria japonica]